ncbi:hypothetical protein, partial [Xanthomonas oryzae]|uniref:hypothetical protein n=1 Tax=Xanthomonas oryzae TaxID=347 RepID=UPI001C669554
QDGHASHRKVVAASQPPEIAATLCLLAARRNDASLPYNATSHGIANAACRTTSWNQDCPANRTKCYGIA